jgi:hypothetical protein
MATLILQVIYKIFLTSGFTVLVTSVLKNMLNLICHNYEKSSFNFFVGISDCCFAM